MVEIVGEVVAAAADIAGNSESYTFLRKGVGNRFPIPSVPFFVFVFRSKGGQTDYSSVPSKN